MRRLYLDPYYSASAAGIYCNKSEMSFVVQEEGPENPKVVTTPPSPSSLLPEADMKGGPTSSIYFSIFAMLFCCFPCALVGLMYSVQGVQEYQNGEYKKATAYENKANNCIVVSVVTGVTFIVGCLMAIVVTYALVYSQEDN